MKQDEKVRKGEGYLAKNGEDVESSGEDNEIESEEESDVKVK